MAAGSAPRVSVLLPTHNRADVLPFAIGSAMAQTLGDFELLVVGDGCTDNTAEVVQAFDDPRIRWLDLPKAPGIGYINRNVALRQARGEIVAYLAHDDLWFPDHLAQLVQCLDDNQAEFVYSLPLFVSVSGRLEPMVFNLDDPRTWQTWHKCLQGYLNMGGVVHQRACFERYGYWSETLRALGDWELWMRIVRNAPAPNFAYLPVATNLHFVANWRRYGETRMRAWWRRLRVLEGAVPPALQLDLARFTTEQEAAWTGLSADPAGWVRAVRRDLQIDLDRRGAYYISLSDALEAGRRAFRRWRTPKKHWADFSPPDTTQF